MIEREYDVLVYGAGPAGVAAAIAAAGRGQRTLLVDDGPDVGGASVCGLFNIWHGEADTPLAEQARALTRHVWGRLIFEPEELSLTLRRRLEAAGVELMLNSGVSRVKCKNGAIRSVSCASGGRRVKLTAWSYVDASQSHAVARLATQGYDGAQGDTFITLLARIGGIDTRVHGVFDGDVLRQYSVRFQQEQAAEDLPRRLNFPELIPCLRGGTAVLSAAGPGIYVEDVAGGLTAAESRCREDAYAALGFLQRNVPGYENCYLIHFAPRPFYLEAPKPVRLRTESPMAYVSGAIEDIPVMAYNDAERPDPDISVPLGALMCRGAGNLLMASSESMRPEQIPLLMACGGAVGRVAAEAVLYDGDITKLDADRIGKAVAETVE